MRWTCGIESASRKSVRLETWANKRGNLEMPLCKRCKSEQRDVGFRSTEKRGDLSICKIMNAQTTPSD